MKRLTIALGLVAGLAGFLGQDAQAHERVKSLPTLRSGERYNPKVLSQMVNWYDQQISGTSGEYLPLHCESQGPFKVQVEKALTPKAPLLYFSDNTTIDGGESYFIAFYDKVSDRTVVIGLHSGDATEITVWKGQILKEYPYTCERGGIDFLILSNIDYWKVADSVKERKELVEARLKELGVNQPVNMQLLKYFYDRGWPGMKSTAFNPNTKEDDPVLFGIFTEGRRSIDVYFDGLTDKLYDGKHPDTPKIRGAVNEGYRRLLNQAGQILREHAPQHIKQQKGLAAKIRGYNTAVERQRIDRIRQRAHR